MYSMYIIYRCMYNFLYNMYRKPQPRFAQWLSHVTREKTTTDAQSDTGDGWSIQLCYTRSEINLPRSKHCHRALYRQGTWGRRPTSQQTPYIAAAREVWALAWQQCRWRGNTALRSDKGQAAAPYIAVAQIQSGHKSFSKHHRTTLFEGWRVVRAYVSEESRNRRILRTKYMIITLSPSQ